MAFVTIDSGTGLLSKTTRVNASTTAPVNRVTQVNAFRNFRVPDVAPATVNRVTQVNAFRNFRTVNNVVPGASSPTTGQIWPR